MADQGFSRMRMFTTHSERPTMTSPNAIPADAVLVAIDIAKACNEVLIEAPSRKRRRRLSVLNNRAEHDRLVEVLDVWPLRDLRL